MKVVITVDIDPGALDPEDYEQVRDAIVDACGSVEAEEGITEAIALSSGYVMESLTILDVKASA